MLLSMKMNSVEDFASQSVKEKNYNRSVESESAFGEGKLVIELKIPKEHGGDKVMEDTRYQDIDKGLLHKDSDKRSACVLCNKTFKSGKALGGHMRIHSQKGKKPHQSVKFKNPNPRAAKEDRSRVTNSVKNNECEKKKKKKNNKKKKKSSHTAHDYAGEADIDERPSCAVCQKKFPSRKSVYGHMRKHSDRKWRGSRRPLTEKARSGSCLSSKENPEKDDRDALLSDDGEDGGVDLTVHLRGWHTGARRGRKRRSSEMDAFDRSDEQVATVLIMLSGEVCVSELEHKQKKGDEFEDVKGCDVSLHDDIKNAGSKMLIKNKKAFSNSPSSQDIDLNKLPASSDNEAEAALA